MSKNQPSLFSDYCVWSHESESDIKKSSKKLLRVFYKIRNEQADSAFLPVINKIIDQLRAFSSATPTQIEETVMYAIENQMCWTIAEILEETSIDKKTLKGVLQILKEKKLIKIVRRFIPGSDRQYYLIKSRRQDVGEMTDL